MKRLSLDPIDRVCCTELHLEWADGREYWSEDPAEVARAVMYRRRVRGGRGLPYAVTCWREAPGNSNTILWEMEWTVDDLRPRSEDIRALLGQQVPPSFIYALFSNAETLAMLHEFTEETGNSLPALPDLKKKRRKRRQQVLDTCT